MMLTGVLLAALTASPTPSPTPSAPAIPAAVEKAITANYAQVCTTALDPSEQNVDALLALFDPAFVNVDAKGTQLNHAAFVTSVKEQLKTFRGTDCSNTFVSISSPDATTVVVVNEAKLSGDVQSADGKHDLDYDVKSEDTWKLQGNAWLETQSKDLETAIKVDGIMIQESRR